MFEVLETEEFIKWKEKLRPKEQAQISTRIENIKKGHFGDAKWVSDFLAELRWKNGRRVYFAKSQNKIILLNGGNKNSQKKDIAAADRIRRKL